MAIAPVNKFISLAVPVAPGEQKLYEVPTGASSLLLYAQVSNVGINTYPTVTLIQRRESRSTNNKTTSTNKNHLPDEGFSKLALINSTIICAFCLEVTSVDG